MINWNKVEEDILTKLHNSLQEIDPDSAELKMGYGTLLATGKEIKNYTKSLIEKEFKLIVKGRVIDLIRDKKLSELLSWQYLYKNISIYITNDK